MGALLAPPSSPVDPLRAEYLALVPTITRIVRGAVRHVPCPDRRAELAAEAVALGWRWYRRLAARGRDPGTFPVAFAYALARSVRAGRRLVRADSAVDVLSPACRLRHGVNVMSLMADDSGAGYAHALAADARAPVPDQVAFRVDFRRWRAGLPPRRRRLLDALAAGTRTGEAAARFGVSAGRVSQLRRGFRDGWLTFCGDAPVSPTTGGVPC